jgi:hypothetical protein
MPTGVLISARSSLSTQVRAAILEPEPHVFCLDATKASFRAIASRTCF